MNVLLIFKILSALPNLMQLLISVITEVHNVQAQLPGAPGAEKSQKVIDTVKPIADVVGAEVPHVQEIINSVVDVSKSAGLGAFGGDAGA